MKKYRIYRVVGKLEYKDVEAESDTEAYKHKYDASNFKVTDSNNILFATIDYDFDEEKTMGGLRKTHPQMWV